MVVYTPSQIFGEVVPADQVPKKRFRAIKKRDVLRVVLPALDVVSPRPVERLSASEGARARVPLRGFGGVRVAGGMALVANLS